MRVVFLFRLVAAILLFTNEFNKTDLPTLVCPRMTISKRFSNFGIGKLCNGCFLKYRFTTINDNDDDDEGKHGIRCSILSFLINQVTLSLQH